MQHSCTNCLNLDMELKYLTKSDIHLNPITLRTKNDKGYCKKHQSKANLKKLFISYHSHHQKISCLPGQSIKLFFTLFKLNITFYFRCYLHHNCCVSLNRINTQLHSSAKPLHNVPSCILICKFLFSGISMQNQHSEMDKNLVLLSTQVNR